MTDEFDAAEARSRDGGNGQPPFAALAECTATFHRWLQLPDNDIVLVSLGAAAANLINGDPLWMMIVGPPGSGKTEVIAPLVDLEYVHAAATLTEASLLSGTAAKERAKDARGGLLRIVGDFGIILAKDFTSVLTMNRDARASVLSALREVYDGSWTRHLGVDGGRTLHWSGKCGVIGAVTPTIDRHHAVLGALGERFVFYRLHVADPSSQARQRMRNRGRERLMRDELSAAVRTVLDKVKSGGDPRQLTDNEVEEFVSLATFVVAARTAVERDQYSRDVEVMPEPEAPGRLVAALGALHSGIEAIGATAEDAWRIVSKVAWDSIPAPRSAVLRAVRRLGPCAQSVIIEATGMPRTTLVRQIEDLELLGLVRQSKVPGKQLWLVDLTAGAVDRWPRRDPECSRY